MLLTTYVLIISCKLLKIITEHRILHFWMKAAVMLQWYQWHNITAGLAVHDVIQIASIILQWRTVKHPFNCLLVSLSRGNLCIRIWFDGRKCSPSCPMFCYIALLTSRYSRPIWVNSQILKIHWLCFRKVVHSIAWISTSFLNLICWNSLLGCFFLWSVIASKCRF